MSAAVAGPYQCAERYVGRGGLRYWCIGPDTDHETGHFWDLEPGQPEPEPHDYGGMST